MFTEETAAQLSDVIEGVKDDENAIPLEFDRVDEGTIAVSSPRNGVFGWTLR